MEPTSTQLLKGNQVAPDSFLNPRGFLYVSRLSLDLDPPVRGGGGYEEFMFS